MNQASIRAFGHNPFTMRRFVVNLTNRLFVVNEGLSATAALKQSIGAYWKYGGHKGYGSTFRDQLRN
jgi:hypothetical protein